MKIAIIYATNSGGTYQVSKQIARSLSAHDITIKKAADTNPAELLRYNVVLFGSPSWNVGGKEGMPVESMQALLQKMQAFKMVPKHYAVFGCGDSGFAYFCGAVDVIDKHLRFQHSKVVCPPLKIDEFFLHLHKSEQQVDAWVQVLKEKLKHLA